MKERYSELHRKHSQALVARVEKTKALNEFYSGVFGGVPHPDVALAEQDRLRQAIGQALLEEEEAKRELDAHIRVFGRQD